jgi:hypothetical protein
VERLEAGPKLPAPVTLHEQLVMEQMVDERHDEQGISLATIDKETEQRVGESGLPEPRRQVARDVGFREAVEQELASLSLPQQLALDGRARMPVYDRVGRPQRAQDQQARRLATLGENGEQIERGVVAPLEILEDQHEGGLGAQRCHADRKLVERVLVGARGGAGDARREPQHPQKPARRVLAERCLRRLSFRAATDRGHDLEDGQVGLAAPVLLDALAAPDARLGTRRASQVFERGVDEGRLPDSGLARDEYHLASTRGRIVKRFGDRGSLARPADHESRPRCVVARGCCHRRRGADRRGARRGDEAVPPSRDGLDEAGRGALVAEGDPQLTDRDPHDVLGDRHVSPDNVEERLLGHQLAGVFGEVLQDSEGLGAQRHRRRCPAQDAPPQIELERWKLDDVRSARR